MNFFPIFDIFCLKIPFYICNVVIITRRDMRPLLNAYLGAGWGLFVALIALVMTMAGGMGIWSIIISSPFFIISFLNIRNYYKKAPIIEIDKEKILFGSECFFWRDLKQINLVHERPADQKIDLLEREGVRFVFNNGTVKYMHDGYYSNSEIAKLFLEQVVYNNQDDIEVPVIDSASNLEGETFTIFKGVVLHSFTTVIFCVAAAYFVVDFRHINSGNIFGYICTASFIISVALNMNYFLVSDRFIVIKKNYIPWVKKIYNLKNIKEVVITKQNKTDCLKIIRTDFVSETFYAFGFSLEQWHGLQQQLEVAGVQVKSLIDFKV